jgi:oxygen-independent coproporphyrinogen-3 oxidase
MELPYNTVFSQELRVLGADEPASFAVADWPTKRAWVSYAFDELARAGYEPSSAYTMVKDRRRTKFVYRDSLWHGADMFGTGVASFGHANGVHIQNGDEWETYIATLEQGELPLGRALPVQPRELLIRELILQLKTGWVEASYFRDKFGAAILKDFGAAFGRLAEAGELTIEPNGVEMTRQGLLHVDRLLPEFFEARHRTSRYT